MLHEALRRAGHVVPASEIAVRTRRRASRPLRPLAFALVLGIVCAAAAGGALVLHRIDPSFAAIPLLRQIASPRFDAVAQAPPETATEPSAAPAHAEPAPDVAPVTEAAAAPPVEPAPTPVVAPPSPTPETRLLLARGDSLLRSGDLAAARLFYQRAAEQGDGAGALGVAKTYDPLFLDQAGFRHLRGDPVAAARWYGQAEAAGTADATERLARLRAAAPR